MPTQYCRIQARGRSTTNMEAWACTLRSNLATRFVTNIDLGILRILTPSNMFCGMCNILVILEQNNAAYIIDYSNKIENNTWCVEIPDLFRVLNMICHELAQRTSEKYHVQHEN